jgi:Domain of unknown function (DUF4158)
MVAKTPRLLTAEQCEAFVRIPADLSERDLGRFYTLSARDPVEYIAQQVDVDPAAFAHCGERDNTIFEHLDELRREFGFQNCGWPQLHALGEKLLPLALESDRSLPLIETGVECLRAQRIIAPGMTTLERLVWSVQRLAQRRVEHWLLHPLTVEQRTRLDELLQVARRLIRPARNMGWSDRVSAAASCAALRSVTVDGQDEVRDKVGGVRRAETRDWIPARRRWVTGDRRVGLILARSDVVKILAIAGCVGADLV